MARLTWDGRGCTNPPEGWEIGVLGIGRIVYWQARQPDGGACHISETFPTEAQAKKACEVALLRLGVLEPRADVVAYVDAHVAPNVEPSIGDFGHRDGLVKALAAALAALEVEAEG